MLEFCKTVLVKVSFDKALFAKELKKSVRWLKKSEIHLQVGEFLKAMVLHGVKKHQQ